MATKVPKVLCHGDGEVFCRWNGEVFAAYFSHEDNPEFPPELTEEWGVYMANFVWREARVVTIKPREEREVIGPYDEGEDD